MDPQELLKTLVDELQRIARTETIVGEPITAAETTIIPVCRVMLGFGGGSGQGEEANEGEKKRATGGGGGGGGGLKIEPAAFIVIKGEEVSILAAPGPRGKLAELFEKIPDLIEKIAQAKQREGKENEKEAEVDVEN